MSRHAWSAASLVFGAILLPTSPAFAAPDPIAELKRLSVDELLNVEVTSVSRTGEGLRNAAAAVAVVTREDLRRSGVTTVPDALRMVPGMHVARQTSSSWAVSARGFSSVNSEKLLVLSDTRSIYTPLFAGVLWDAQDYLLEDIERVEVIRGPGAALWGSNAVNGVINITTRSAADTHGTYLEAGGGTFDRLLLGGRYGSQTDGGVHYRVFGRYTDRASTPALATDTDDAWRLAHVGFRADAGSDPENGWTVQGDAYAGEIGELTAAAQVTGRPQPPRPLEADVSGGNLLARWRHRTSDSSDLQLRAYYDVTRRDDPSFVDTLHTFDVDLQQRSLLGERHELIWGAAFRLMSNRNEHGVLFAVEPESSDDLLYSSFVQDRMSLDDDLELTLGTKLEHNDFSGFEVQPSVRLAWQATPRQTLWTSVSRAVRVPTRLERDIAIDASNPLGNPVVRLLGNRDFDAERLIAYETGYRWQPTQDLSFDLAAFYNDYEGLASLELGTPFLDGGQVIVPIINQNLTRGHALGAELLAEWHPTEDWRLSASYSGLNLQLESAGADLNRGVWAEDATPRGQAMLRSQLTLSRVEVDAQLRHHTRIRRMPVDPTGAGIDAYTELDLRLGWQVGDDWRVSLVGQNLLHDEHLEFGSADMRGAVERAVYLKAEWRRL